MAFREVEVLEVREVLRQWLRGHGYREAGRLAQMDRKTARRYVSAAVAAGLKRDGGEEQLTDALIGDVLSRVRQRGPGAHGTNWAICEQHRDYLDGLVKEQLVLTKVEELLKRRSGVAVPYRTLHRFVTQELGLLRQRPTVRVEDGEPGSELQVDFGRMGLLRDRATGHRSYVWALIFTACYSRHTFVWLTYRQTVDDVIEGFEAAWSFFGGVFPVVIPDNLKAIVDQADPCAPRLNTTFLEYAQKRGFTVDPARVRRPKDKARVERTVPYVRNSFFAGEDFGGLAEAQTSAERWCRETAGRRVHGTTQKRPAEVFEHQEKPLLWPAPEMPYEVPLHGDALVGHDHHITFANALYSVPTLYIGKRVTVRADRHLVRVYLDGAPIKTHPRQPPGGRSTDPNDYPEDVRTYAARDTQSLQRQAEQAGAAIGEYLRRLLDCPAPWTRMRSGYRLLGLVRRYGAAPVEEACCRALSLDVVDVKRIERMLERALEGVVPEEPGPKPPATLRFLRPASDYSSHNVVRQEVSDD
ncbi:MAG: IS21 family transposase [Myxococcales bacterium]|nr:IS21 family transposase [Myxococcales bacterium]